MLKKEIGRGAQKKRESDEQRDSENKETGRQKSDKKGKIT